MEFNITTKNHKEEYLKYYNDFVSKKLFPIYFHTIVGGVFLADALFLTVISIWARYTTIIINILLIYFVAVFFLLKNRKSEKSAEKYTEKGVNICKDQKEINYIFTSEKITGKSDFGETIFLPEHIYEIDIADDYVAFKFFSGSLNFVRKDDFESEEKWQDFLNLLKTDYRKIKRFYENKPLNKKHYLFSGLLALLFSALIIGFQVYKFFY